MSKETNITEEQAEEHKPFFQIIAARLNAVSPFNFGTLKEIPLRFSVVLTLICTALCFGGICSIYRYYIDPSMLLRTNDFGGRGVNEVYSFVKTERSSNPHRPKVIIAGECYGGHGIATNLLEQRLGLPATKISLPGSNVWETFALLRTYQNEMKDVRVVLAVVTSTLHPYPLSNLQKNRFLAFRNSIFEKNITTTSSISLIEQFLPVKNAIRQIKANYQHKNNITMESVGRRVPPISEDRMRPSCVKMTDQRNTYLANRSDKQKPVIESYSHELRQVYFDLAEFCREKRIHLVYVVVPTYSGGWWQEHNPREFERVLTHLNTLPHVSLVAKDLFDDISKIDPAECYDQWGNHLCGKGLDIYTNWLADQMLNDPKVVAALKTPRQPEEFFVKKWLKPIVKPVYLYVKNGIKSQREEHKKTPIFVVKDKPKPTVPTETKTQTKTATTGKTVR